jgi:hypothetical protein
MSMTDQHVDDDGVVHRLEPVTPHGFRPRCDGCSFLWPCPSVRILPEPLLEGGEVVADLVDVGWSIYQRGPAGSDGPRPGGVVIAVDRPADPNLPAEGFRVLDWQAGRPRFRTLVPGEFDPLLSNPPNAATCRSAARKLAEMVARKRGTATPEEVELARTAYFLLSAVA